MLSTPRPELELPLLNTKFSIPLLPPEYVHRPRLTERINQGARRPLTLLCAPAGFGKTNLLVEWSAQTAPPPAWLTLDAEDNDLVRFFRYLTHALQTIAPQLGQETLEFVRSARNSGLEVALTLLINEMSAHPGEIVLALDELHVIENETILSGLNFLLKHPPRNLHLIAAGRSEPAIDLPYLRAKGWVIELGADELRFTGEEVAQFFQQKIGLQLPPATVTTLEERTEGWVTALQLAAISLRGRSNPLSTLTGFQGDAHYLVDFLSEEVLNRQREEVRSFLLRSSILAVLSGPLCEAVVDPNAPPGSGAAMLDRLEHANLFVIPLDPVPEWYRYHHLFADFLRHVLEETYPEEISELHKRAAIWFEAHGNLDQAFTHALACCDFDWAAAAIERGLPGLLQSGELLALKRWIGSLPKEVIQKRHGLGVVYAWSLIAAYQLDQARLWLDWMEQSLRAQPQPDAAVQAGEQLGQLWNPEGGLALCRSLLALTSGDMQQAAEYSRAAAAHLQEDNPFIQSMISLEQSLYYVLLGDTVKAIDSLKTTARIALGANNLLALVVSGCRLAQMQALQGRLSQAVATLQKAEFAALGPDGVRLPLAGLVDNIFGQILFERDLLAQAKEYLERGRLQSETWSPPSSMDGLIALARLLHVQGEIDQALALIAEAVQIAVSTESSRLDDVYVSAVAARLALQRSDLEAATLWLNRSDLPALPAAATGDYPYHIYEYVLLTRARYELALGRRAAESQVAQDLRAELDVQLQKVFELLRSIEPQTEQLQRVSAKIEILAIQALAEDAQGRPEAAESTLLQALALGEPEDYRRTFLDEGRPMAELLKRCLKRQKATGGYRPTPGYVEGLLEALSPPGGLPPALPTASVQTPGAITTHTEDGLAISLSARELQVLTLIAEGKSNQEISAQLYLALNTVKRHAYNIYAKLQVTKRTQAVVKARQLGLIP